MLMPGKYTASVESYGLQDPKDPNGLPSVWIEFRFLDQEGQYRTWMWYGYLTEKARPITLKALLTCGLKGENLEGFEKGHESKLLDRDRQVEIELADETWQGKTRTKVKWINPMGGAKFEEKMASPDAVKKFKGLNLKGELTSLRAETGIASPKDDGLPF